MEDNFRLFKTSKLFDIHPTKAYKMSNRDLYKNAGTVPVLSNSSCNNGIGGYSSLKATENGNMITFSDLEELMPAMLQHLKDNRMGSPAMLGQNYTDEHGIMQNDACHKEWDKILDRMIFLWRELDEETCSEKNKYEKEYSKASDEFFDKYGFFGEGLETEEEKEKAKKTGSRRVHFMSELPEYEEISRLHMEEEKRLVEYREKCKDEVFDLMKKYFFALWD